MSKFDELVRLANTSAAREQSFQDAAVKLVESIAHGFADFLGCHKKRLRYVCQNVEGDTTPPTELSIVSEKAAAAAIRLYLGTLPGTPEQLFGFVLAVDLGDGKKPALFISVGEKGGRYKVTIRQHPNGKPSGEDELQPNAPEQMQNLYERMYQYMTTAVV